MSDYPQMLVETDHIEPVVLGGGKRLFPDDGRSRALELVSTTTTGTGVQICTYRPVGA